VDGRKDPTSRAVGIDLVRVLGVLAIIAGHVWYTSDLAHLLTYSWHVPVYFLLGGYLWIDARTLRDELRRRWRTIVVPYIAWWCIIATVYVLWAVALGHGLRAPLYYLVLAAWGGAAAFRPFTAFWFFSAFVVAALYLRALQHRPAAMAWAGAVTAIAVCHAFTPIALRSPLAVVQGVGCAVFVLVGVQLRRVRPRLRRPGATGVVVLLAGTALMALPFYRTLEIKSADFGTPGLSVVTACLLGTGLILVAEALATRASERGAAVLSTLAECAIVAIFVHGAPMLLLGTSRSGSWSDFTVVAAISLTIALLVRRSRWSPVLSGRERPQ
jgi:fucose 4-O-acetylase-like acetyltransferase